MSDIALTIDDQQVTVPEGTTLLEACQSMGIRIPTLCYYKALPGYGACRLCLVEVEQRGRTKVTASCTYDVKPDIIVRTSTERVQKTRRIMVELLLARCPNSEPIKKIAAELGVTETRFPKKDEDCILCGLCTRVCSDLMKAQAIDFSGRGDTRKVGPAYDKHSPVCMVCGACHEICPTGTAELHKAGARPARRVPSDYDAGLVTRPAIYIPFQQAIPRMPVLDREVCVHFGKDADLDACRACESACPAQAIDYDQQDETVELDVGAVVLAPGCTVFDADRQLELSSAWHENVVTSLQFERILSASGPTGGQVTRPSDGEHPKRLAFIQCVGSRDHAHNYCSSVCCMYATKEAIIAKEHQAGLDCTVFYMDMRAFGKGFEAYFERAKDLGVRYVRCRPSEVKPVVPEPEPVVEIVPAAEPRPIVTTKPAPPTTTVEPSHGKDRMGKPWERLSNPAAAARDFYKHAPTLSNY